MRDSHLRLGRRKIVVVSSVKFERLGRRIVEATTRLFGRRFWATERGLEFMSLLMVGSALITSCAEEERVNALSQDDETTVEGMNIFLPSLGKGVNLSETETFNVCVVGEVNKETRGFDNRLYNERLIKTKSELNETMDISASVSARGLFFSGSAESSYFKNVDFQTDAVYWLVDSKYILGHDNLDLGAARLSDAAKAILEQDNGLEAFTQACGDRFYSSVQKGARYTLLYDFHGEEKKALENIHAKASGSGFGISASAEFTTLVAAANKAQYLSIHSHIQGGGSQITEHATDADDLKQQLGILRADVLDRDQGVTLKWYVTSYEAFPEFQAAKAQARARGNLPRPMDEMHREAVLAYLYGIYSENRAAVKDVQILHQRARGNNATLTLSDENFARGREMLVALNAQNEEIATLSRRCLRASQDEECSTNSVVSLLDPADAAWRTSGVATEDERFGKWLVRFHTDPRITPHRHSLQVSRDEEHSPNGDFSFFNLPLRGEVYPGKPAHDGGYEIMARLVADGVQVERVIGVDVESRVPRTSIWQINLCRGPYERSCSIRLVEQNDAVKIVLTVFDDAGFPYSHPITFQP